MPASFVPGERYIVRKVTGLAALAFVSAVSLTGVLVEGANNAVATASTVGGRAVLEATPEEHGKYLVEHVARCPECHTPRTESGELDRSKWMKGATLATLPMRSPSDWRRRSPDLSSTSPLWLRWGQDGVAKFLQTARSPHGSPAEPPMPSYTMAASDAEAIVAYLRTLP